MLHHFDCPDCVFPKEGYDLVFDWDDETGEITGPSAETILDDFKKGYVSIHPIPSSYDLTSTKNKTDLAAIIGWRNVLPPELADYYPKVENIDPKVYDEAGNVVGFLVF